MRQRFKEDYVRLNKDLCGRLWLQCMVCVLQHFFTRCMAQCKWIQR